jgi:hypothetical protein
MKKLFVAATFGLALVSCGGPSICDCVEKAKKGETDEKCTEVTKGMSLEEIGKETAKCK